MIKIPIDFGLDNPWALISFFIVKLIFLPNWASLYYKPTPIHVTGSVGMDALT